MVPDLDLQLQVAIKALTDAVAPAVDPSDKVAVEQLHLAIATFSMVRDRLPFARRYARRQLEDAIELAHALHSAAQADSMLAFAALDRSAAAARMALADVEADTHDIEAAMDKLTDATVAIIAAAQNGPASAAVDIAVLQASAQPIERGRAWCLPSGFEPNPNAIRTLADLV